MGLPQNPRSEMPQEVASPSHMIKHGARCMVKQKLSRAAAERRIVPLAMRSDLGAEGARRMFIRTPQSPPSPLPPTAGVAGVGVDDPAQGFYA